MSLLKAVYFYDGMNYEVEEPLDIHRQLQDQNFRENYFKEAFELDENNEEQNESRDESEDHGIETNIEEGYYTENEINSNVNDCNEGNTNRNEFGQQIETNNGEGNYSGNEMNFNVYDYDEENGIYDGSKLQEIETHTEEGNVDILDRKNEADVNAEGASADQENVLTFSFDENTTRLLLTKYLERKEKFRNPKIKKKKVWCEIVSEFKKLGYTVDYMTLDRKFRNLKSRYKTINDNNKATTTGRGRITWIWQDLMYEILYDDKSVHFEPGLSSMGQSERRDELSTDKAIDFSIRRLQFFWLQIVLTHSTFISTPARFLSSRFDTFSNRESSAETSSLEISAGCSSIPKSTNQNDKESTNNRPDDSPLDDSDFSPRLRKFTKGKALYHLRKQQLDLETKKVKVLESIENKLSSHIEKWSEVSEKLIAAHNRQTAAIQRRNNLMEAYLFSSNSRSEDKSSSH